MKNYKNSNLIKMIKIKERTKAPNGKVIKIYIKGLSLI